MKKVILCAGALLFGTMAFAQVSGAPDAQVVAPLPGTGGHLNAGQSVQNGDNNAVRVRQAGTENSVYTEQDNGSGIGSNLARVIQTGDVQAGISAYQNAAEVQQSGTANQSTTRQEGDLNNAYTGQGQTDDSSAYNKASIRQGVANQAESNYAAIEQDGNYNQASTLQIVDNSDAWTDQDGNDNKSMIVQNAAPEDSDGHLAQNKQDGDRNESSINQSGDGARNSAYAFQLGDDNKAKQLQTTDAAAGSTGNRAYVNQGWSQYYIPNANPVTQDVYSDIETNVDPSVGPASDYIGSSYGAVAFQTQGGSDNEAENFQIGGDASGKNYSEQEQAYGSGNDAAIIQLHDGAAGDNYAKQYQVGWDNRAGMIQKGSGNKGLQDQRGENNDALSSQVGDSNLLNVHQRGNDNYATSMQNGDDNRALLVQKGGNSYVAQQVGTGNQIDVLQLGPSGNFHTDAIECSFDAQLDPWMDYTVPGFDLDPICPDC